MSRLDGYIKIYETFSKKDFIISVEIFDYLNKELINLSFRGNSKFFTFVPEDEMGFSFTCDYFEKSWNEFLERFNYFDGKSLSSKIRNSAYLNEIVYGLFIEWMLFSHFCKEPDITKQPYEKFLSLKIKEDLSFSEKTKKVPKIIKIMYLGI